MEERADLCTSETGLAERVSPAQEYSKRQVYRKNSLGHANPCLNAYREMNEGRSDPEGRVRPLSIIVIGLLLVRATRRRNINTSLRHKPAAIREKRLRLDLLGVVIYTLLGCMCRA